MWKIQDVWIIIGVTNRSMGHDRCMWGYGYGRAIGWVAEKMLDKATQYRHCGDLYDNDKQIRGGVDTRIMNSSVWRRNQRWWGYCFGWECCCAREKFWCCGMPSSFLLFAWWSPLLFVVRFVFGGSAVVVVDCDWCDGSWGLDLWINMTN
jgi:hypothetical protein